MILNQSVAWNRLHYHSFKEPYQFYSDMFSFLVSFIFNPFNMVSWRWHLCLFFFFFIKLVLVHSDSKWCLAPKLQVSHSRNLKLRTDPKPIQIISTHLFAHKCVENHPTWELGADWNIPLQLGDGGVRKTFTWSVLHYTQKRCKRCVRGIWFISSSHQARIFSGRLTGILLWKNS